MIPNQPPDDFCKFLFMDPGTTRSAALFVAVPGPADDDDPTRYRPRYVHFYDELMLYNATASEFAREVKKREGTTQFYDFVMDQRAGRQHPMGFDITVFEQYQQAFSKVDLVSMRGGPFEPGSDDVDGRELLLKQWMRDGTVVVAPHLVNLKKQMEDFFKKKTDPTKRELRGVTELIHCYDSATEVLTKAGWKPFAEASYYDELATVNLESDELEYQRPTQLIGRRHTGEMVKIGGKRGQKLDALVTPEHRMVIHPGGRRGPKIVLAKDLKYWDSIKLFCTWKGTDHSPTFTLPRTALSNTKRWTEAVSVDREDFAEFMGWYVAEGYSDDKPKCPGSGYRVCVFQVKESGKKELRSLLSRLPWRFVETPKGFQASSKQLWEYLHPFGKTADKFAPQWILDSPPNVIKRFLRGAILGDGNVHGKSGGWRYATTSRLLADQVQECAIKSGISASIRIEPPQPYSIRGRKGQGKRPQFHVISWTSKNGSLGRKEQNVISGTHYDGMVYCATVPNGTLIVRRNGRPMVCGNCAEYCAAYFENGLFWVNPVKLDKLDEKDECTEILKDLKASNWNMRESLLRARIRHDQEQLIECVVSTEGEFPGEPGDQQWWPKDQAVPAGWDVVDKNDHTKSQKYAALDYLRSRRQGHVVF